MKVFLIVTAAFLFTSLLLFLNDESQINQFILIADLVVAAIAANVLLRYTYKRKVYTSEK